LRSALTAERRAWCCAVIEETDDEAVTRVVVVTAVDPGFSAGVDFKEVRGGGHAVKCPADRNVFG
jgi:enoyl-CoA hydratase/carnithine racemase